MFFMTKLFSKLGQAEEGEIEERLNTEGILVISKNYGCK
jgi:hypothetical protein